jgi:LysM repeat protein
MKPTLVKIAACFLIAVLVIVGLAGCERSAREREAEPTEPVATAQATQAETGAETAAPGETVVSAVPLPSEGSGTVVAVTQPPAGETSEPQGQATAMPTEEAQPAPESGAVTPQQGEAIWHTVQQGETLASIARRYGTSWQAITQANSLVNPNQIYVGQKLKIPSGSSGSPSSGATGCRIRHTVKNGEWVWQIARNYGVSPYDILAANGMTIQSANNIQPGTVLCIP